MELKFKEEIFNIYKDKSDKLGDGDIRKRFIDELLNQENNLLTKDTKLKLDKKDKNIVYHELGLKGDIKRGRSKVSVIADLCLIKDIDKENISIGIEIKSDKDTTTRLKKQMEVYFNYFDYVYVLTTPSMVSGVLDVINELKKENKKYDKIGLILYHQSRDAFELIKESSENKSNEYEWIKLLWNEELVQSLMLLGEYNLDKSKGYYYKRDRVKRLNDLFKNRDKYEEIFKDLNRFKKVSHLVYNQFHFRAKNKLKGINLTRHEWSKEVREDGDTLFIESGMSSKLKKGKVKIIDTTIDKQELVRRVKSYWAESLRNIQDTYDNLSQYSIELRINKEVLHEDVYQELEQTLDNMYELWDKVEKETNLIFKRQLEDIEIGKESYTRETDYNIYLNETFKEPMSKISDILKEFKGYDEVIKRLLYG